ncbi:MAG: hypothetical protein AB9903_31895 [Vulcanimicrobiota bacterium]
MFFILLLITAVSPLTAQNYHRYSSCRANLQNIATALEMYSTDNAGEYPPMLSYLTPSYLSTIPSCPNVEIDTYSCSYKPGKKDFYVCCLGNNHPELLENMPAYSSKQRLIETPNPDYKGPEDEKKVDTATSLILLGVLAIFSYLTYRKK